MTKASLVSVIIPSYNSQRFLTSAINSVLDQTFQDYELIVVDDGSTDSTPNIISSYGDQLVGIRTANRGPSAARNRGIAAASGTYIALLDSDDTWSPEFLSEQVSHLETNPEVALVFSDMRVQLRDGGTSASYFEMLGYTPTDRGRFMYTASDVFRNNIVATSTVVMKLEIAESAGLFDEAVGSGEDWDLWLRIAARAKIAGTTQHLAERREHDSSLLTRTSHFDGVLIVLGKVERNFPNLLASKGLSIEQARARIYFERAYTYFNQSQFDLARRDLMRSLRLRPRWRTARLFLITLLGTRIVSLMRKLRKRH